MNFLIFVKQVPKDEDLKLDPVTKTLIRPQSGVISEYDKCALELAVRLKEELGGTVTAVTMGPPASAEVLRYALAVGADEAFLLSDRAMGGADAYATVTVLSAAKKHLEKITQKSFDLILCGKQASDSDTSLVMPELAEALSLPQISFVNAYEFSSGKLHLVRETDDGTAEYELSGPTVVSVGKTVFDARRPNIKLKLKANHTQIPSLNAEMLGLPAEEIGVPGSRTIVGNSYFPEHSKECVRINGTDAKTGAAELIAKLTAAKQL